jgi:thioredoxin-related protein
LAVVAVARAADDGVAWQRAADNADVERAFAQARAADKPVLLYWGAKWCPPCNQLKATLFNRHDFIERSKSLVAVEIDGDLPGAQKLGARFKVSGYPTMVLMRSDGAELMRLPGEADAPQVLQLLEFGLGGGRAAKEVLADARAGKVLSGAEWRMLAFYSWISDEAQLLSEAERPGVLAGLAAACPRSEADSATRLMLKALADSDDGKGVKSDAALRQRLRGWLGDPVVVRAQMDVLTNFAPEITKAVSAPGSADRKAIVGTYDVALRGLQADTTLSRADRAGRTGRAGAHSQREERAPSAHPGAALAAGARVQRGSGSRGQRRLRTPGGDHGGGLHPRPGRAVERVRRAAESQPGQEPLALLPDEPAWRQCAQARPQRRGAALVRGGVCTQRGPGDPAAMGRPVRERAGRAGSR